MKKQNEKFCSTFLADTLCVNKNSLFKIMFISFDSKYFEELLRCNTLVVVFSHVTHVTVAGRHLTVFNTQDLLQVGGRWDERKHTLDSPFQVTRFSRVETYFTQGVLAGIVYNGLRPLDMAHDKETRTKIRSGTRLVSLIPWPDNRGSVRTLTSIPYDYKEQNPALFQVSNNKMYGNFHHSFMQE